MKQYAASPVIQQYISDWAGYFNTDWTEQFYNIIWNIDTAQGIGLDIWGRIVVIGRQLEIPLVDWFGFSVTDDAWGTFNNESFYTGEGVTQTFTLADPAYRTLILAKAMSNISSADSGSINRVLNQLFPNRGRAWVNDLGSMSMRYVFEFALEPWEKSVLVNSGALPRPAGVRMYLLESPVDSFVFAEAGDGEGFNNGTFLAEGAVSNVT